MTEETATLTLTPTDQLALKAALERAAHDARHGTLSVEGATVAEVRAVVAHCGGWADGPAPRRVTAPRRHLAILAAYVADAMRLRGYVVGRPEANAHFVACYRRLTAAARGEGGWRGRLRRLLRRGRGEW